MVGTTQEILNWARNYIPDPKTRTKAVRDEYLGMVALPTGNRETFYLKHNPIGTISLYIEPYTYSSTASLGSLSTTSKCFMWAPSTLSCTLPDGDSDPSTKPDKYKKVIAMYEYTEQLPYSYSDTELAVYIPQAIGYLNNTFSLSYSYTGTISTLDTGNISSNTKELFSRAVALVVRKSYIDEQKRRGLGVRFRGPLQSIDSVQQMKDYRSAIKELEKGIEDFVADNKIVNTANVIDVYTENVVES